MGWYPFFACPKVPCRFCLPAATLPASGSSWQAEIAGIVNPSTPPPDFTAYNGTWPMLEGSGLAGRSLNMANAALFNGAVDRDSSYVGNVDLASFGTAVACLVYAELPGFDPDGIGSGLDNGLVVAAVIYGTTGGGLSAVVFMYSGANWLVYQNIVLSPSSRKIDCATIDITLDSLAELNWTGASFFPHFDPSGVSIRITAV